jgi:hypothetical protein
MSRPLFRVRWSTTSGSGTFSTADIAEATAFFEGTEAELTSGQCRGWVSFARGGLVERISNGHGTLSHRRPVAAERMAA